MITTRDGGRMSARTIDESIAPVLANIVERPNSALLAPHHNDTLIENVAGDEVSGRTQLVDMGYEVPTTVKNA
jgi:hypothetical protein